jgi:3-hydroxyacyl-CoA dehydrogenase
LKLFLVLQLSGGIGLPYNIRREILGKTAVVAKDTPAFIGNRVGIFGIQSLFHLVKEMGLTIEEVDKLTGPVIGRPKSATFRTVDVVGLDSTRCKRYLRKLSKRRTT